MIRVTVSGIAQKDWKGGRQQLNKKMQSLVYVLFKNSTSRVVSVKYNPEWRRLRKLKGNSQLG